MDKVFVLCLRLVQIMLMVMLISAAGANNVNSNVNVYGNNVVFTIKGTKSYVSVVTLSVRDNQKLLKRLSKGFKILEWI